MTIPLIFCVDVEPDPRLVNHDAPEPWVGYEITQRYLRELRPRIEAVTGAPVHYSRFLRIDTQIEPYGSATWIADRYGAHMEEIQRAGERDRRTPASVPRFRFSTPAEALAELEHGR